MKFRKTTIFSTLFCLGLLAGIVFQVLSISPKDRESYRKLMEVSNSKSALKVEKDYTVKQLKEGTVKTLLLSQGEERKMGHLSSASSILYFAKANQSSQLIEEMNQVRMIYQEELIKDASGQPFQIVVQLNADAATYFYSEEKLSAEKVHLARYKIPSHTLTVETVLETPFFYGTADSMTIAFGSNQPALRATNLKAASR
jgi:hypothetical protein